MQSYVEEAKKDVDTILEDVQRLRSDIPASDQVVLGEVFRRVVKYLIEGMAIAIAAFVIPQKTLSLKEVIVIAVTGAAVFSILDYFAPSIGGFARQGAGFGIGTSLVGARLPFPGVPLAA